MEKDFKKQKIRHISLRSMPFFVWLISVVGFIACLIFIEESNSDLVAQQMHPFQLLGLFFVITGVASFGIGILIHVYEHYRKAFSIKKMQMKHVALFIVYFLLFPLMLIVETVNPLPFIRSARNKKIQEVTNGLFLPFWLAIKLLEKCVRLLLISITVLPVWLIAYFLPYFFIGSALGLISAPVSVEGQSMEPTIIAGEQPSMLSYWKHSKISQGDIVVVQNANTNDDEGNISYIKRVIGLPGDEIEIRNGFVYLNGELSKEKYTAKPRSTFGGDFIKECQKVTVPDDSIFVMGDNRAHSHDTRAIGFISLDDIKQYLPMEKQTIFEYRWRDSSGDDITATLPSFEKDTYYKELNIVREENGLKPLVPNEKLEKAAESRAKFMAENGEINIANLGDSKYPMEKALQDAKYWNVLKQEIATRGFYDSYDLARLWLSPSTKDIVLNGDYQETGIGVYLGEVDGCTVQLIIQEFGGYIPPSYKESDIQSWEQTVSRLNEILPSWEKCRNSNNVYSSHKDKCERIIEIIRTRIGRNQQIANKMRANKWLSSEEQRFVDQDEALYKEQEEIATLLNGIQW